MWTDGGNVRMVGGIVSKEKGRGRKHDDDLASTSFTTFSNPNSFPHSISAAMSFDPVFPGKLCSKRHRCTQAYLRQVNGSLITALREFGGL